MRMSSGARVALLSGARAFSPLSLSPHLWLDPSDLSTLFQDSAMTTPVTADGDPVGGIVNKGSGGNWTQATAGSRPIYHTSGGLHWIEFDGTDDFLDHDGASLQTLAMAARVDSTSSGLDTWICDDNDGPNLRLEDDVSPNDWQPAGGAAGFDGAACFVNGASTTAFTPDANHVVRVVRSGGPAEAPLGLIGRASAALGRYADGRVYNFLGFGGELTAGEAANLDRWLADKAGVTL